MTQNIDSIARVRFAEIMRFTNSEDNFRAYRDRLARVEGPFAPFIGMFKMMLMWGWRAIQCVIPACAWLSSVYD